MLRFVLLLVFSGIIAISQEIRNLHGEFRHGQVFLNWEEHALPPEATLQVWASDSPFTSPTAEKFCWLKIFTKAVRVIGGRTRHLFSRMRSPQPPLALLSKMVGRRLTPPVAYMSTLSRAAAILNAITPLPGILTTVRCNSLFALARIVWPRP